MTRCQKTLASAIAAMRLDAVAGPSHCAPSHCADGALAQRQIAHNDSS